jgi:hypothetical protein
MVGRTVSNTRLVGVMAALHSSVVQTGSPVDVVMSTTRLSGVRRKLHAASPVVRKEIWIATYCPTLMPSATTGLSRI